MDFDEQDYDKLKSEYGVDGDAFLDDDTIGSSSMSYTDEETDGYYQEALSAEWVTFQNFPVRPWTEWELIRAPWTLDDTLETWEYIQRL